MFEGCVSQSFSPSQTCLGLPKKLRETNIEDRHDDEQTQLGTANDTRRAVPRATQPLVELPFPWCVRHETLLV